MRHSPLLLIAALAAACGPPPPASMPPVQKGPATHPAAPRAPRWIALSRTDVRTEMRRLMNAPKVTVTAGTRCDLALAPLTRALKGRSSAKPLPLKIEPDVPFELLCSALAAAWSAGVLRVRLELSGETPQEVRPPPLPPGPAPPGKTAAGMQLSVVAGDTGYFIGGAGSLLPAKDGTFPSVRCDPTSAGRCEGPYDHAMLAATIRIIKGNFPREQVAVLSADPGVPARVALKALAALRGAARSRLFPRLSLVPFADADARVAGGGMLEQVNGSTRGHAYNGPRPTQPPAKKVAPTVLHRVPRAISGPRPGTTLTPSSSAAVIRTANPGAQKCYERALTRDGPGLAGKLVMSMVVGPKGRVADATVHSDGLGSKELVKCVRGELLKLRFRPPFGGGKVVLQVPYIFKAK